MSPALIFAIASNAILPFWLLLIVAPRWRGTNWAVHSVAVPVVLGFAYLWLLLRLTWGGEAVAGSSFFSLAGVMALFSSPIAVTMGWIHYLVFDLFVRVLERLDSIALSLVRELADQLPVQVILRFREDDALAGDDLGGIGISGCLRLLHGLDESVSHRRHDFPAWQLGLGIDFERTADRHQLAVHHGRCRRSSPLKHEAHSREARSDHRSDHRPLQRSRGSRVDRREAQSKARRALQAAKEEIVSINRQIGEAIVRHNARQEITSAIKQKPRLPFPRP